MDSKFTIKAITTNTVKSWTVLNYIKAINNYSQQGSLVRTIWVVSIKAYRSRTGILVGETCQNFKRHKCRMCKTLRGSSARFWGIHGHSFLV